MRRFFLDQDINDNWFIIPADSRSEWFQWLEDNMTGRTPKVPDFADPLLAGPLGVTFTAPVREEL